MHFFHLSDLHIGKQLYGYSLLEDQEWILTEIYELIREKRPDGVLIAGVQRHGVLSVGQIVHQTAAGGGGDELVCPLDGDFSRYEPP